MNRQDLRKKRLETAYKKVLTESILFDLSDKRLKDKPISISRVVVNADMSVADVYFSSFEKINKNKVITSLQSAETYFLNVLRKTIKIRYLPKMVFHYDTELEEVNDVLGLIEKIAKERPKDPEWKNG